MDRFRMIQPSHLPQQQYLQPQQITAAEQGDGEAAPGSKVKDRQRHTEEEWDAIKPDLSELLLTHGLADAAKMIKQTHKFEAGLRAYRSKIVQWGLKQHQSAEELGIVVAKRDKRKREEGKNTVVIARGEQLATERLDLFERRAKYKQSASAETPQSIEYYTPANNGRTPDAVKTPAGLRNTLLHQGPQNPTPENKEHRHFCKRLLILDQTTEPVVVLRPRRPKQPTIETETETEHEIEPIEATAEAATNSRIRYLDTVKVQMTPGTQIEAIKTESRVPQRPFHDLHQSGHVAMVGRGRFSKKEKPLRLLWQMKKLCHGMNRALYRAELSGKARIAGAQSIAADSISYVVRLKGQSAGSKEKRQGLIDFCQQNSQIHSVLGLTKVDRVRWLQSWSETLEEDAPLIVQTANHLFGNLTSSYPEMDILEVLIYFHTTAPNREPILLRAAAGWDNNEQHSKCLYCNDNFQIVDFMGSSGAVKLHISDVNSTRIFEPFSTFESFREAFTDSKETVYPSWSELAYIFQGWCYAPLLRRCPCGSKTHKNLSSEHYINVFDEQTAELEVFDPTATSELRVPFESFPSEDNIVIVYGVKGRTCPSEETWDPAGVEDSEEEFENFPEAAHDDVSNVRPTKVTWAE